MKRGRNLPAGISLNRYCKLIGLTRSNCYYKNVGESAENINLMNIIDRLCTEHPTAGARTIRYHLRELGYNVNLKRIRRLMSVMGIEPIYPKKSLSKVGKTQYIHPYLLRDLVIDHANQVWSTDISYIPMPNGFMYLYAMIDVHSRYLLGWRLSNTLTEDNCLELMKECVLKHGVPEIVNTDQGSQYTSPRWVDLLQEYGVKVSMDGRGRCKDNIWIERFWRTIKQEVIYINPTDSVTELRTLISNFIEYYNTQRPHQSLGGIAPTKIYFSLAA